MDTTERTSTARQKPMGAPTRPVNFKRKKITEFKFDLPFSFEKRLVVTYAVS